MERLIWLACVLLLLSCKREAGSSLKPVSREVEKLNFPEFQALLEAKKGKTLVVNFWATWCKPCVEELPLFEEVGDSLGGEDLEVLLVSLDFPDRLEAQLLPFIREHEIDSQVILLDDPHENEWIPKVDPNWSGAIPATWMIRGEEKRFFEQPFDRSSLFREISEFIESN